MEYEDGKKNLGELVIWADENTDKRSQNEATTRLHLIDRLFFECLDWEREDCTAEERVNGNYIDYSFRCPECLLAFEAKKEDSYFELPVGKSVLKQTAKKVLDECIYRLKSEYPDFAFKFDANFFDQHQHG